MKILGMTDTMRKPLLVFAETDYGTDIRGVVAGRSVTVYRRVRCEMRVRPWLLLATHQLPQPEDFSDRHRWAQLAAWDVEVQRDMPTVTDVLVASLGSLYGFFEATDETTIPRTKGWLS